MRQRRYWTLLLRAAGLAVLCVALARRVDWQGVVVVLNNLMWPVVAAAVGIGLLRTGLMAWRWLLLVPPGQRPMRWWGYVRCLYVSLAAGLVIPGALGGDIARSGMLLATLSSGRTGALVSVAADRAVGLLTTTVLASVALILAPAIPGRVQMATILGLIWFAGMAGLAWLRHAEGPPAARLLASTGRFGTGMRRIYDALASIAGNGRGLWVAFLMTLPIQVLGFWQAYLLARSLGLAAGFADIAVATALSWLVTSLPVTFAGLGLREASYVFAMGLYGVDAENATALSLSVFAVTMFTTLAGLFFLFLPTGTVVQTTRSGKQEVPHGN